MSQDLIVLAQEAKVDPKVDHFGLHDSTHCIVTTTAEIATVSSQQVVTLLHKPFKTIFIVITAEKMLLISQWVVYLEHFL